MAEWFTSGHVDRDVRFESDYDALFFTVVPRLVLAGWAWLLRNGLGTRLVLVYSYQASPATQGGGVAGYLGTWQNVRVFYSENCATPIASNSWCSGTGLGF